jgi:hypothetical protein
MTAPSYHRSVPGFAPSRHADWSSLNYARVRSDAAHVEFVQTPPAFRKPWVRIIGEVATGVAIAAGIAMVVL